MTDTKGPMMPVATVVAKLREMAETHRAKGNKKLAEAQEASAIASYHMTEWAGLDNEADRLAREHGL